jgi:transposase-like protein
MKCPICANSNRIEIDIHSDGYANDLFECTDCGAIWVTVQDETLLLNKKVA